MAAVAQPRQDPPEYSATASRSVRPLELIHGSFSTRKVSRHSPLLGGLHRGVDGALSGLLIVVTIMATLTLYWQNQWSIAFARLETTRVLVHKLNDSTAMLERYLLQKASLPKLMVPTKVSDLLYLDPPSNQLEESNIDWLKLIQAIPVRHGY